VLVVGAEMLRNLNLYNYHPLYGYLIPVSSITLFIMASLLIIKSVFFASKSISLFFFDKVQLDGVFFKVCSVIIWLLYTLAISAMMVISILGTIENKDNAIDVQHELSGEMHLNVDKVRQSFDKLKNENRNLKNEIEKLKNNDK
jgi:cell division protein FtsB